ncbi:hypothetical protein PPTG_13804 [Phytophthora nicotianae INRA-310]|uniref:endo-polygalacturonase n=1 Tax=Phytophthora nicotianae (strain INRA-310) TaxID=761204 RepID=W2PZ77_PHYN3|nr:hypothetical protein PPTG_13804 [Phytophthora nicotianae INRA-310]ETN05956.1 hypothetical protein PPTG_13804 [Phytophthora nicotianae INRA-310]
MKFVYPATVLFLLASAAVANQAQGGATNCNAKTSPSITTASTSTAGSSAEMTSSTTTSPVSAASAVDASVATATSAGSIGAEADDSSVLLKSESASASTDSYTASSSDVSTQYSSTTYSSYGSTASSAASANYATSTEASYSSQAASETTGQSSSTSSEAIEAASSSAAATTDSSNTNTTTTAACTLSGTYSEGTDVSSCSSIVISDLSVPKGVTLDLTDIADGATITFEGTTTFGEEEWDGPLILLTGNDLTVTGSGTLDGQGSWYWEKGTSISKPVFFRLKKVLSSTLENFNIKNSPYRTFSILDCEDTTLTGLTLDSSAGDGTAKNTDGFDLSRNVRLTISDCTVYNQDDCLAMQSSNDTTFSGNTCSGGHGISIGSLGGDSVTESDIVSGLTVKNNKIVDSVNGIRIKTIIDLYGTITGATYTDNTLSNVENAIVIHSDYSKSEGGYTGVATSKVEITDITISGLSGTANDIYDILVNPDVVSGWTFSDITVTGDTGNCSGEPSGVGC